jgi:hypothetical protein
MKYEIWAIILIIIAGLIVDWYFSARDRRKILGPRQRNILAIASLLFILPCISAAQIFPAEGTKLYETPCMRGNCDEKEDFDTLEQRTGITLGKNGEFYLIPDECGGPLLTKSLVELADQRDVVISVKIGVKVEGWSVGFLDKKLAGSEKMFCVRTTEIWIDKKLIHEFKEEFPLKKKN